jgi:uncharacterized membrane protein (DUF485 family)
MNEKCQEFGEMVKGAERLAKPWKIALLVSNIVWAVVLIAFITLVTLVPAETNITSDSAPPVAYESGD